MRSKYNIAKLQVATLLLPGVLVFVLFTIYPIAKLFYMSFYTWDFSSMGNNFCGLKNYLAVLSDKTFQTAFVNTVIYTVATVPGQMVLGLLAATFIHSIPKMQISFRIMYYLPVITSWVIVSLVFRYIFNTEGMLNYLLTNVLAISKENIAWLDSRTGAMFVLILLGIWKGVGWNMVIFLAALQSVGKELYESAEMDGCGSIAKFFYITLPCIKSTIFFALVMLTIGGFNAFTSIKLITNGNPMHQTETVLTWMYYKAFNAGEFSYAAALSFIVAMVLMVLAILQFKLMKQDASKD